MDNGKKHFFITNFNFLINECGMNFIFQKFSNYRGFYGPIYTYSFYNCNGCITFHNIVQRGEWGWYKSQKISTIQNELLESEINQTSYIQRNYLFASRMFKDLAKILKKEAEEKNTIFGIRIIKK